MTERWEEWSKPPQNPVFIKHSRLFRYPPVVSLELAPGWAGIVDSALSQISALLNDEQAGRFRTRQMKEKVAQLWWSWDVVGVGPEVPASAIDAIVLEAQRASASTCQECGATSRLRRIGDYFYTLCDSHDLTTRTHVAGMMGRAPSDLEGELERYLNALRERHHSPIDEGPDVGREIVDEGRRQAAIDECIRKVASMTFAGAPDVTAEVAFLRWAQHPIPALGGQRPIDLLETTGGQKQVLQLLDAIGGSAYL